MGFVHVDKGSTVMGGQSLCPAPFLPARDTTGGRVIEGGCSEVVVRAHRSRGRRAYPTLAWPRTAVERPAARAGCSPRTGHRALPSRTGGLCPLRVPGSWPV